MIEIIIGFLAGILSSMGFGGGSVLVIYLVAFAGFEALKAQGINLLYFIPTALVGLIFHIKNRQVAFKTAGTCVAFGIVGAVCGALIAQAIGKTDLLKNLFAVLILIIGLREVFQKTSKRPNSSRNQ